MENNGESSPRACEASLEIGPAEQACEDATTTSTMVPREEVERIKAQLVESQEQLESSRLLVSKLEGLIGSLKSGILHLDPINGKAFLQGEIAAMESVFFGIEHVDEHVESSESFTRQDQVPVQPPAFVDMEPTFCTLEESSVSSNSLSSKDSVSESQNDDSNDVIDAPSLKESVPTSSKHTEFLMNKSQYPPFHPSTVSTEEASLSSSSSSHGESDDDIQDPVANSNSPVRELRKASKLRGVPSHPRMTGPSYWKEFSAKPQTEQQQRQHQENFLEIAMQKERQQSNAWSLYTMFQ